MSVVPAGLASPPRSWSWGGERGGAAACPASAWGKMMAAAKSRFPPECCGVRRAAARRVLTLHPRRGAEKGGGEGGQIPPLCTARFAKGPLPCLVVSVLFFSALSHALAQCAVRGRAGSRRLCTSMRSTECMSGLALPARRGRVARDGGDAGRRGGGVAVSAGLGITCNWRPEARLALCIPAVRLCAFWSGTFGTRRTFQPTRHWRHLEPRPTPSFPPAAGMRVEDLCWAWPARRSCCHVN